MNIQASALLLLLASFAGHQAKPARTPTHQQETPHLLFVKEFVRELIEDEDVIKNGQKELREAQTTNENLSAEIYFSKSAQLSLRSQIAILKSMHLSGEFADLIPTLIAFDQHQIDLHQRLIDISTKFIAGPKPGVDYPALLAKMPGIRAELDDVRKKLFQASAWV